jgi:ligand-binding sensor domain-containing protein
MRLIFIISLFLPTLSGFGQIPQVRQTAFEFEYQQLKVSRIQSDHNGFIWMGTQIGLFRHDGVNVDYIPFVDSSIFDPITVIHPTPENEILVGTKHGNLYITQKGKLHLVKFFLNPNKASIQSLTIDVQKQIWVGTAGAGVFVLANETQYSLSIKNGLPDDNVNALLADKRGMVWIGTDAGICLAQLNNNKLTVLPSSRSIKLKDHFVTVLEKGEGNSVFIGTQSGELYVCSDNFISNFIVPRNTKLNFGSVVDLTFINKKLWIATETKGLMCLEDGHLEESVNHSNSAVPDKIVQITTDREGSIWIVDKTENVFMVNDLFSFVHAPQLKEAPIQAIASDLIGGLWYSNAFGTYLFKRGKNIPLPSQLAKTKAICIYPDSTGNIWLGTFGSGVLCYNPHRGTILTYNENNGLANNNVISISGNGENVWLATFAGISIGKLKNVSQSNFKFTSAYQEYGLPENYYYQVFIDSKGNVWFGSDGQGLSVIKNGKLEFFSQQLGKDARIINSICEDAKGNIWFNSPEQGLFCYQKNQFKKFGTKDGIREIGYNSICADSKQNLLIVNSRGIDMFNIQSNNILYHDKEIGFVGKAKESRVSAIDVFGRIWVGAGKQLILYNPESNLLWQGPEPTIKSASVFLSPFEMLPGKVFSSEENYITFDYVGIWYHLPDEVNYLIQLEGYDPNWIKSRNLQVTYPQLPPGDYVFKVKALPSNNFRSSKELRYAFTICKPYYQTWWFIGLFLCSVFLVLYVGFVWRIKQLREKEKMNSDRIQFQFETLRSQVNPHFLFNSFNTLSGLIEKNANDAVKYVEHLSDFFRSILQYKDKNLIPLAEELAILDDYIYIQKKRFGEGFSVNIDANVRSTIGFIAPMTLQILLENSIKHNIVSKSQPLDVEIYILASEYICISNPIQLKSSKEKSTQIGLTNITSRYAILQSKKVIVEKNNGQFVVKIPLIIYDSRTDN